jgi:DNA-binding GntR family transcriptional regulator
LSSAGTCSPSICDVRAADAAPAHCRQHLHLLELIEHERNEEASAFMREHLLHTMNSLAKIENILQPAGMQTQPEISLSS